jgi:hypothetical protein
LGDGTPLSLLYIEITGALAITNSNFEDITSQASARGAIIDLKAVTTVVVDGVTFKNIKTKYRIIRSLGAADAPGFTSLNFLHSTIDTLTLDEGGNTEAVVGGHFHATHFEGLTLKTIRAPVLLSGSAVDASDGVIVKDCKVEDFEIAAGGAGRLFEGFWSGILSLQTCSFTNVKFFFTEVNSLYCESCIFTGGVHAETILETWSFQHGTLLLAGCTVQGYGTAFNLAAGAAVNVTICKTKFVNNVNPLVVKNQNCQIVVQDSYFEATATEKWLDVQFASYFALQNSVFKASGTPTGPLVVAGGVERFVVVGNTFTVAEEQAYGITWKLQDNKQTSNSGNRYSTPVTDEFIVPADWEYCLTSWWNYYEDPVPEPATDPKAEPATDPKAEPATDPKAEPATEKKPDPKPDTPTEKPDPPTDPKPDPPTQKTPEPAKEPTPEPAIDPAGGSNNNAGDSGLGSGAKAGIGAAAAAAAVAGLAAIAAFVIRRRKNPLDEVGVEPETTGGDDLPQASEIEDDGRYVSEYGLSDGGHD